MCVGVIARCVVCMCVCACARACLIMCSRLCAMLFRVRVLVVFVAVCV